MKHRVYTSIITTNDGSVIGCDVNLSFRSLDECLIWYRMICSYTLWHSLAVPCGYGR